MKKLRKTVILAALPILAVLTIGTISEADEDKVFPVYKDLQTHSDMVAMVSQTGLPGPKGRN